MKLSLRELFALMALIAAYLGIAAWIGVANPLYWLSLLLILVSSMLFLALVRKPESVRVAPLLGILGFGIGYVMASLTAMAFGVVLVVVGLIAVVYSAKRPINTRGMDLKSGQTDQEHYRLDCRPINTRVMIWILNLLALSVVIGGVAVGFSPLSYLTELRDKYPMESLAHRIAVVEKHRASAQAKESIAATLNEEEIEEDGELLLVRYSRRFSLSQLHDAQTESFVKSMGFGVVRMSIPRESQIQRPPLRDIPLSATWTFTEVDDEWEHWPELFVGPENLSDLHRKLRWDFLSPDAFGYVDEPKQMAAGFIEHAFHNPVQRGASLQPPLTLTRFELVSLLRFPEPAVYVLDHLPRMDQLRADQVATRPLDDFETRALEKLRGSEDVVIEESNPEIRMLGALRATKECLECHQVNRGALLGAFTYRWVETKKSP